MNTFKDSKDRSWKITIDYSVVETVRDRLGVDLSKALIGEEMQRVAEPALFVDVLYLIVEPQASERGISPEQFGRDLGRDGFMQARNAFRDALLEFSPPRWRNLLQKLSTKIDTALDQLSDPILQPQT